MAVYVHFDEAGKPGIIRENGLIQAFPGGLSTCLAPVPQHIFTTVFDSGVDVDNSGAPGKRGMEIYFNFSVLHKNRP